MFGTDEIQMTADGRIVPVISSSTVDFAPASPSVSESSIQMTSFSSSAFAEDDHDDERDHDNETSKSNNNTAAEAEKSSSSESEQLEKGKLVKKEAHFTGANTWSACFEYNLGVFHLDQHEWPRLFQK